MKMLVGIAGRKRAGKDTAADALVWGLDFERMALADPLKAAAREIFGLSWEQTDGGLKETVDPRWAATPRQILQRLGTEGVREGFGGAMVKAGQWSPEDAAQTWVRALMVRAEGHPRVVVPDVRFANEAEAILSRGGLLLVVHRPGLLDADDHPSEREMEAARPDLERRFPGQIDRLLNAGSVEGLHRLAVSAVERWQGEPEERQAQIDLLGGG